MADKHAAIEASTVDRTEYVKELVRRSIAVKEKLIAEHAPIVVGMADICIESLAAGGKLFDWLKVHLKSDTATPVSTAKSERIHFYPGHPDSIR